MDGDTHENEQTAHGDRPMRIRELTARVRAVALDMSVDRTTMGRGLIGGHTSTKKIFTAVQDGAGRAMGMTIRNSRTEDQCIDRSVGEGRRTATDHWANIACVIWSRRYRTLILRMVFFFVFFLIHLQVVGRLARQLIR